MPTCPVPDARVGRGDPLPATGGGKAAIAGDFVLTANEVNPVLRILCDNGIEVTALHNHMFNDDPRLFFMHFWANDELAKLAAGSRSTRSISREAETKLLRISAGRNWMGRNAGADRSCRHRSWKARAIEPS
jgi:Domain of Unknown Function (DUF1259)